MSKYKLTLNKSDNTSNSFEFEIPDEEGTYELWFQKEGFGSILVGDVVVDGKENIYNLKLGMSDGNEVDAGTFTTPITYQTVTFVSNNTSYGTVSQQSIKVPYGSTVSVSGNTVTINGVIITATEVRDTAQYDYAFSHWSQVSAPITSDREIWANFTRTVKNYTVTFGATNFNYGSVSQTSLTVPYGATYSINDNKITVNGTTITATAATDTAQYDYSFSSWGETVANGTITGDRSFTAIFKRATRTYRVSFVSSNTSYGTVSQSYIDVPYGTTWSISGRTLTINGTTVTATPTASNAEYYYLGGWQGSSGTVTGNTTITANFTKHSQYYTVSYPAKPSGVSTFTISHDILTLVENPTSAGTLSLPYGSVLYISASASSSYTSPSINGGGSSCSITITGNTTITLKAGSYVPPTVYCDGCGQTGYHYCSYCGEYHYADDECEISSGGGSGNIQCDCGEYGGHDCPCYGTWVDPDEWWG